MSSPANSSLRPAWHRGNQSGGRGFQPPPTVASERLNRSQSAGAVESSNKTFNKFAALDDDEDVSAIEKQAVETAARISGGNSRSEALRSGGSRSSKGGGGRSLADLAARAPERERSGSYGSAGNGANSAGSRLYGGGGTTIPASSNHSSAPPVVETNVIRFTREKLLSMRPQPLSSPPEDLKNAIEGSVILSETAQDPVCWDNFDAEAIWATVSARRTSKAGVPDATEGTGRRSSSARREPRGGAGRWERGVALPPPDQAKKGREKDAENPSDLWDDPTATGAATDFSAFGAMPEDEPFDFEKMAEATRKFEEEMHGNRSRASSDAASDDPAAAPTMQVDPKKPLATIGTTIQSGSMDDVNVFEDFDDPAKEKKPPGSDGTPGIKAGDEDQNASSRLMAMIGVTKEPEPSTKEPAVSGWGAPETKTDNASVPLNPWGGPLLPGQGEAQASFDLESRLRAEQKARDAEQAARRKEQEEAQRLAQQQADERARQAAQQQQQQQQQIQQQAGVQSQVELVLMERISTILENSWGQSDLVSILSTLHAEDSRVIPLLNTTDALRALILRNPRRVALRPNPVFGTEMAALLMTNSQWQQENAAQQQAEAQARSHQEELKRREEQQRQQMQEQQNAAAAREKAIIPDAPWYYSDPQNNIQGPFRGEEMRQWLEAGYFKSDLPISQQQTGPFHPLSALFPDLSVAFVAPRDSASEEEAKAKARREAEEAEAAAAEAEAVAKEKAEREAREAAEREQLAREAAERERRAQEQAEHERRAQEEEVKAATAAAAREAEKESSQLKMMLGMGAGQAETPSTELAKATEKRPSKASKKSLQQKPQEPTQAPAQPKLAGSVWGSAAKATVTRKSMSEIQNEEARAAAILAMQREGGRASSSGWANVAASRGGSTAWSGGAAKQRPAAVLQATPIVQASTAQARAPQPQVAKVAATNAQMAASQQGGKASASAADDFGAQMSPVLEKWCKDQMQKLNGTEDLTLVSFCMTLNDPIEIRQYLTTYLGSNVQVNNFATEFINKKTGAKANEEWETTANVKKNRKKKGGGR